MALAGVATDRPALCAAHCAATAGCAAFSYDGYSLCLACSSADAAALEPHGATAGDGASVHYALDAGVRAAELAYSLAQTDTECAQPSRLGFEVAAVGIAYCAALCANTEGCVAFSFGHSDGWCAGCAA